MANKGTACDVFITHAPGDAALARRVADACRASGLEALTPADLPADGRRLEDAVWEALSESRALLVLLPPTGLSANMAFETGAAWGWNKPIFAVVSDPAANVPLPLAGIRQYPASRLDDVLAAIRQSAGQLSAEDHAALARLYTELGVPADQYFLNPPHLQKLVERFQHATGKTVAGERLLSELLRMRKQRKLTKIRFPGRSKRHSDSA